MGLRKFSFSQSALNKGFKIKNSFKIQNFGQLKTLKSLSFARLSSLDGQSKIGRLVSPFPVLPDKKFRNDCFLY